jgi:MFS family permease
MGGLTQEDPSRRPRPRRSQLPRFLAARVLSAVSLQMSSVAVGWQVYALSRSTFQLGMVGLAQFLPMITLALAAGHLADRYDRRLVARSCQLVEAGVAGLLAVGSFTRHLDTAGILAAVAVLGAARAFEFSAMSALLPGLIAESHFTRAAAASASAIQVAFIVGPAVGGLLYAAGPTAPYATAAVLSLAAGVCSTQIRPPRSTAAAEPPSFRSVFSGVAFIRSRPVILGSISLDLFAVLLGGATALLPVYARDILHTGPWGLGAMRSAPAAGALALSLLLSRRPLRRRVGVKMFASVIVFGLATIVFAFTTSLALALAALLVLGAADVVSVVIRSSLVQLGTPDEMRGRVSAVNWMFIGTSNQLGEFESGVTASLLGTVPAVALGGLGTIAVALLWMRLFPELRRVDGLEGISRRAAPPAPLPSSEAAV